MLTEERHTPKGLAFKVEIPSDLLTHSPHDAEVRKRLELSAKKGVKGITIEDIDKKLKMAEQKRKLTYAHQVSPQQEKRRQHALEHKKMFQKQCLEHKENVDRQLWHADEKRKGSWEEKRKKLREHMQKVEKIRKEHATRNKEENKSMKTVLQQKHMNAEQKHQQELGHKVNLAHHSAEKKKPTQHTGPSGGQMPMGSIYPPGVNHDDIKLPVHNPMFKNE